MITPINMWTDNAQSKSVYLALRNLFQMKFSLKLSHILLKVIIIFFCKLYIFIFIFYFFFYFKSFLLVYGIRADFFLAQSVDWHWWITWMNEEGFTVVFKMPSGEEFKNKYSNQNKNTQSNMRQKLRYGLLAVRKRSAWLPAWNDHKKWLWMFAQLNQYEKVQR